MEPTTNPDLARLIGPDRRRMPVIGALIGVIVVATLTGLLVLWPRQPLTADLEAYGIASETVRAEVTSAVAGPCEGTLPEEDIDCVAYSFLLLEADDRGVEVHQEIGDVPSAPDLTVGDRVVLSVTEFEGVADYQFADRERRSVLAWVTLAFAVAVVVLGRWRGASSLVGLGASLALLVWFIVPAVLAGSSPVMVALVGSAAIALLALYLAHGLSLKTHVALLGTLASLGLTVGLATMAVSLARFSGYTTEESLFLTLLDRPVDAGGLVLAGIVLGALGALDDVTVTQASAVWELRAAGPGLSPGALFAAGLRIGRDHIASTVNTLLLAYAGASLPLLLLFALSGQSAGAIVNSEVIATEVVRTLVGSIGLVAAVPITTALAAFLPGSA
jgi:uncharacterized membrane protein